MYKFENISINILNAIYRYTLTDIDITINWLRN